MANTAKGDAMKRPLNVPNTPAKKLKQAKLSFQPISSPCTVSVTSPKKKKNNLIPKVVLHRVDGISLQLNVSNSDVKSGMSVVNDCKENKNPKVNKCLLDTTSQQNKPDNGSKATKVKSSVCDVIDLTSDGNTSEKPVETENYVEVDEKQDHPLVALPLKIELVIGDDSIMIDENRKLFLEDSSTNRSVFADDKCENEEEIVCDVKVKHDSVYEHLEDEKEASANELNKSSDDEINDDKQNDCEIINCEKKVDEVIEDVRNKSILNNKIEKRLLQYCREIISEDKNVEADSGNDKAGNDTVTPDEDHLVEKQCDRIVESNAIFNEILKSQSDDSELSNSPKTSKATRTNKSAAKGRKSSTEESPPAKGRKSSSTEESPPAKGKNSSSSEESPPAKRKKTSLEEAGVKSQNAILRRQDKEDLKLKRQQEKAEQLLQKQQEDQKKIEKKQQLEEQRKQKQILIDEKNKAKQEKRLQKELLLKEKEAEKEKAEQIQKKQEDKLKAVFANFFVKKDVAVITEQPVGVHPRYQVKDDVRVAPLHRTVSANTIQLVQNIDKWLNTQASEISTVLNFILIVY
ncbi:hypothetical protein CHUAL_000423 [Chamberlinius hualienensis]